MYFILLITVLITAVFLVVAAFVINYRFDNGCFLGSGCICHR